MFLSDDLIEIGGPQSIGEGRMEIDGHFRRFRGRVAFEQVGHVASLTPAREICTKPLVLDVSKIYLEAIVKEIDDASTWVGMWRRRAPLRRDARRTGLQLRTGRISF
jgi:hypothetical protein